MKKIIISAPFGNWFDSNHATSTIGTYTYKNRAGYMRYKLWWKMLTKIGWSFKYGGWINKLGLPSPGMAHLEQMVERYEYNVQNKILSIHGFTQWEWYQLIEISQDLQPLAIELNVSCPNVGQIDLYKEVFDKAKNSGLNVIVKLPPINYRPIFEMACNSGIKSFHCCNTFPTEKGGISGKPLKALSKSCIRDIISRSDKKLDIIAGGGIKSIREIKEYEEIGANRFAIGTLLFNPNFWIPGMANRTFKKFEKEVV